MATIAERVQGVFDNLKDEVVGDVRKNKVIDAFIYMASDIDLFNRFGVARTDLTEVNKRVRFLQQMNKHIRDTKVQAAVKEQQIKNDAELQRVSLLAGEE